MELEETVDINTASVEEFVTRLKGVGHSKAKAIVRFRTTVGKFKKLCELTDVPGISQCILERNQGILFCVSNSTDISTSLQRISDNESSLEEGELSESSLMSPGDCKPVNNILNQGLHANNETADWHQSHLNSSNSLKTNFCHLDNEVLTIDTPSTSMNQLDIYSDVADIKDTPVMLSSRTRIRTKSDERTFSMSTRNHPITNIKENPLSRSGNVLPDVHPSVSPSAESRMELRSNRSAEIKSERISTRRRGEGGIAKPLVGKRDLKNKSMEDSGNVQEHQMDVELEKLVTPSTAKPPGPSTKILCGTPSRLKKLFTKRKRVLQDLDVPQVQMKRKLDTRLDINKFQSPEKKACKSLSFSAESNAATSDSLQEKAQTVDNINISSPKDALCRTPSRRFSSDPASSRQAIKVPGLSDWICNFQKWNQVERIAALDELIDACEPAQVRHMLEVIEPQFQRDFISLLPKELGLYVLSFLEPKELLIAAQTCRYWHILCEDNQLWREKCEEESITEQPKGWKAAYLRQNKIEMNWRNGVYKSAKLLKGHDDHVITCLQFSGTRIVSGSDDNTLKVWSAVSGECLRTLTGHTGGVWASQMRGNMIISGSTDRTLKIWNADSGECTHTLYGHTSTVRCMALHENIVISGSRDATLRVWDVDTGECLHVLAGHMAAVRCVCYDGKLVVSGAYDYMVKVWDPVKEECLHTLQGHNNRVYSLQFDGVHVVSGSLDTSIRVWQVETGACLHTLVGHQSLTSGMELKNNILVSGNADSTVKMWDITTGGCLKTLEGPNKHQSAVTCLQFCGKFVITSSDDGTVKLWDVKSGKAIRDLVALDSRGSGGVVWRIRATPTKLVCAVGSRNGTEETKLLVLDFDPDSKS